MSCAGLGTPVAAVATPSDFRVLTEESTAAGEFGLEVQSSVAKPRAAPEAAAPRAVQGLAEIAYGLGQHWELSLQLPWSHVTGSTHSNGASVEG